MADGSGSDAEKGEPNIMYRFNDTDPDSARGTAEARVEVEVFEALNAAMK